MSQPHRRTPAQAASPSGCFPEQESVGRTLALIKVQCDQFTRDPLLQTMAATNWRIVLFRPMWIDIEVVGTGQVVADLCEFIRVDGNSQACSPPQLLTSLS
jgi:hypothetical protein